MTGIKSGKITSLTSNSLFSFELILSIGSLYCNTGLNLLHKFYYSNFHYQALSFYCTVALLRLVRILVIMCSEEAAMPPDLFRFASSPIISHIHYRQCVNSLNNYELNPFPVYVSVKAWLR